MQLILHFLFSVLFDRHDLIMHLRSPVVAGRSADRRVSNVQLPMTHFHKSFTVLKLRLSVPLNDFERSLV